MQEEQQVITDTTQITQPKPNYDTVLLALTNEVLTALKNKNYDSFALFIHPEEGVRFSPNAFVDTPAHKVFTADEFKKEASIKKQRKIIWGDYDASGDPINKTINEYFKEFVYDVDFLTPEKRKVNEFIQGSSSQNNLLTVYEGCEFTESNFSGIEKKYDGMDWRSLRLVFKMKDGKFFLVGVIHDEWTI